MLIPALIYADQFGSPEDSGMLVCVFNNTINQSASASLFDDDLVKNEIALSFLLLLPFFFYIYIF